jgi:hypothetical protein
MGATLGCRPASVRPYDSERSEAGDPEQVRPACSQVVTTVDVLVKERCERARPLVVAYAVRIAADDGEKVGVLGERVAATSLARPCQPSG